MFRNITEIKKANKAAGRFWFSPKTAKFFQSRVETPIMSGRYWVESTTNYDDTAREYKLCVVDASGDIEYIFKPGTYETLKFDTRVAAIDALTDYIAELEAPNA